MTPNRSLIPARKPPQPRLAEGAYSKWSRGVINLWGHLAESLAERSRTEYVSREDIVKTWNGLLGTLSLPAVLARVSALITRGQASYWRSILKTLPPAYDARELRRAWVQENTALWDKLGSELADRLAEALAQPRTDAKSVAVTRAVNKARKENVALISGLDVKQTLQLGSVFKSAQAQGVRHETLIEQVQQITGYGQSRSRLIARDQTTKHNAAVQEAQARAAGITEYTWVCVRDEATRKMHKALDGTVHRYDQPPVTNPQGDRNNPGEDYQCRCSAMPVISLFAGLSDE